MRSKHQAIRSRYGKYLRIIPVVVFIIVAIFLSKRVLGTLPAVVFSVALVGGLVLWLSTTFRTPVRPNRILIPYLITVIFFIIHVYEEYLTDFEVAIWDITGFHVAEKDFLTIAAFAGPIIWLTGAVLLLKQTDFGYFLLSFFVVAMTIAELSHFIFPFLKDGTFHYVSGMYTAALPLIPAGYILYVLVDELKKKKLVRVKFLNDTNKQNKIL